MKNAYPYAPCPNGLGGRSYAACGGSCCLTTTMSREDTDPMKNTDTMTLTTPTPVSSETSKKVVTYETTLETWKVADFSDGREAFLTRETVLSSESGEDVTWSGYVKHDEVVSRVGFYFVFSSEEIEDMIASASA